MSEFRSEISSRVRQVQAELEHAAAEGDDHLVQVSLGQLESLARIAAEHEVPLDGVDEALSRYGLPTPAAGLSLVLPPAPA